MSNVIQNQEIYHYGIKRRSGRYPWGSGKNPYQSGEGPLKRLDQKKMEKVREKAKSNTSGYVPHLNRHISEYMSDEYAEGIRKRNNDIKHDRVIKKGGVCYRYGTNEDNRAHGSTSVTFNAEDLPENIRSISQYYYEGPDTGEKRNIISKYELKKDIKIPSQQNMVDAYIDVMTKSTNTQNIYINEFLESRGPKRIRDTYYGGDKVMRESMKKVLSEYPDEALSKMSRDLFSGDIGYVKTKDSKFAIAYQEELKKRGYDGIPDMFDEPDQESYRLFDRYDTIGEPIQIDIERWAKKKNEYGRERDVLDTNISLNRKYEIEYLD